MKKSFWIAFAFIFLCVVVSGAGIFWAEKSLKKSKKSLVDTSLQDDLSIIKNNIEGNGITLPGKEPEPATPPVANSQAENTQTAQASEKKEIVATEVVKEPEPEKTVDKYAFGILGDTQKTSFASDSGFYKAVQILKEKNPEFLVAVGDLISECDGKNECQKNMDSWKNVLSSLFSKTYAIMGNHDRSGGSKADKLWQDFFSFPTNGPSGFSELAYSLDVKNAHLVFLNSNKPEEKNINSEQLDWLKNDLKANQKDLIFVFFHDPAYPVSSKIGESLDVNKDDRDELWDILSEEKVTAVFSGHEHIASRKKIDGVYQFVFGNTDSFDHELPASGVAEYSYKGTAFGYVEVEDKKITVNTIATDGKTLNSFDIKL